MRTAAPTTAPAITGRLLLAAPEDDTVPLVAPLAEVDDCVPDVPPIDPDTPAGWKTSPSGLVAVADEEAVELGDGDGLEDGVGDTVGDAELEGELD